MVEGPANQSPESSAGLQVALLASVTEDAKAKDKEHRAKREEKRRKRKKQEEETKEAELAALKARVAELEEANSGLTCDNAALADQLAVSEAACEVLDQAPGTKRKALSTKLRTDAPLVRRCFHKEKMMRPGVRPVVLVVREKPTQMHYDFANFVHTSWCAIEEEEEATPKGKGRRKLATLGSSKDMYKHSKFATRTEFGADLNGEGGGGRFIWNRKEGVSARELRELPELQPMRDMEMHIAATCKGHVVRAVGKHGRGAIILDSGDCRKDTGECCRTHIHRDFDGSRLNSWAMVCIPPLCMHLTCTHLCVAR